MFFFLILITTKICCFYLDPQVVPISVDNGECNGGERVNFEITGFSVRGSIFANSCPQDTSMTGVTIFLMKEEKEVQKYIIRQGGGNSYQFQNVVPGYYEIKASHPSWTFAKVFIKLWNLFILNFSSIALKDQTHVDVHWGSVVVEENLVISGFDISGQVTSSDSDGIQNVNMNLYLLSGL